MSISSGHAAPVTCPSRAGPRHCGQSAAGSVNEMTDSRRRGKKRFISIRSKFEGAQHRRSRMSLAGANCERQSIAQRRRERVALCQDLPLRRTPRTTRTGRWRRIAIGVRLPLHAGFDWIRRWQSDLLIYQAGADPHLDDPLGTLGMTTAQLFERDQEVFRFCKASRLPTFFVLAGGYQEPLEEKLVPLHVNTFRAAHEIYFGPARVSSFSS